MVNLIDLLQQKLELLRLEKRYTRRKNRRSTFVSNAQYVDGEYIYATSPTSSKCSNGSGSGSGSGSSNSRNNEERSGQQTQGKRVNRMSKMLGSGEKVPGGAAVGAARAMGMAVSVKEVPMARWIRRDFR